MNLFSIILKRVLGGGGHGHQTPIPLTMAPQESIIEYYIICKYHFFIVGQVIKTTIQGLHSYDYSSSHLKSRLLSFVLKSYNSYKIQRYLKLVFMNVCFIKVRYNVIYFFRWHCCILCHFRIPGRKVQLKSKTWWGVGGGVFGSP